MRDRAILHSDANCFYASVETVLNPEFRGKAIAVCGSPEERHGIVLAKSEKAKRAGVKTGMNGYATARQNGWMSANDIRELENLDRIPAEEGGDLYLINGNMLPLCNAGAFANITPTSNGKEITTDEEVLEVEEPSGDGDDANGTDTASERHHRRGKLVWIALWNTSRAVRS